MVELTDFAASYVLSAIWQIPVLCLVAWLAARIVRRLGPAVEHRIWVTTVVLCVAVPAMPSPRMHGYKVSIAITDSHAESSHSQSTGSSLARMPVWVPERVLQTVALLWALSMVYGTARLCINLWRTRRMLQQALPCEFTQELEAAWQQCLGHFGIGNALVLQSAAIAGPVTLSRAGRNMLLLPSEFFSGIALTDAHAAFAHECAHMQRRDFRNNLVLQVLLLPVQFHPAMRFVRRQLATTREMACDAVAASLTNPQSYRGALLRLARWIAESNDGSHALAMGVAVDIFDTNSLEERMERLKTGTPRTVTAARYALVLTAIAAFATTASALAINSIHLLPSSAAAIESTKAPQPNPQPAATPDTSSSAAMPKPSPRPASQAALPRLIHQVDPDFPQEARRNGDVGEHTCLVGLTVDTNGMPQDVHIMHSAGEAFDANALKAVRQYRFRPATQEGRPIAKEIHVELVFRVF